MKTQKSIHQIILTIMMSLMIASCGSKNDDSPFVQNANGGLGGYSPTSQLNINNASDLLNALKSGVANDLAYLQSGGRFACEYDCPERIGSGIIGNCVRIFSARDGQVGFDTYNKNAEIWQDQRDFNDIIGNKRDEPYMTGVIVPEVFDSYFNGINNSMPLQRTQINFPDFGPITIFVVQNPYGNNGFSLDIPASTNTITNGKVWCSAQR